MMKVYEYKNCGTCQKALKFLDQKKIPYEKRVNVKLKNFDLDKIVNIVGEHSFEKESNFVSFNTKNDEDTTKKIGEIFEKFVVEDITIENLNLEDILKLLWK